MIRVLRIVNRFNLGGPIYNVTNLTKYLPADFETKLIGGLKEEAEEDSRFILEKAGVDYEVIPEMKRSVSPASDLKSLQRIRAIIRGYRPHIVHTHAAKAGMLGRIAAHKEKVPVIVHTFHGHVFEGYFNPRRSAIYQAIERRLASRSDAIVCLSNTQLYDITEKFKTCSP